MIIFIFFIIFIHRIILILFFIILNWANTFLAIRSSWVGFELFICLQIQVNKAFSCDFLISLHTTPDFWTFSLAIIFFWCSRILRFSSRRLILIFLKHTISYAWLWWGLFIILWFLFVLLALGRIVIKLVLMSELELCLIIFSPELLVFGRDASTVENHSLND